MFDRLAFESANDLVFGRSPRPLRCGFGVELGARHLAELAQRAGFPPGVFNVIVGDAP